MSNIGQSSRWSDWQLAVAAYTAAVSVSCVLFYIAYLPIESDVDGSVWTVPLLAELSTDELQQLPRDVNVARELIRREDVDSQTLQAAMVRFCRLSKQDAPAVLRELIRCKSFNVCRLLANLSPEQTQAMRAFAADRAMDADSAAERRVAFASWVTINGNGDEAFRAAEANRSAMRDLLSSLPHVESDDVRAKQYDHIQNLLFSEETDVPNQKLAIQVMTVLPGREKEKIEDLVRVLKAERLVPDALRAVATFPESHWLRSRSRFLAYATVKWLAELPTDQRTSVAATAVFEFGHRLAAHFDNELKASLLERLEELLKEHRLQ